MDYPSNCIKLRELCMPLYTNYLIKHKKFPVTRFTPRKKGSGIVYYLRLSRVLSGDTSKNSMAGDLGISIYNIDKDKDNTITLPVLSGNTPSYNTNSIINTPIVEVLSGDNIDTNIITSGRLSALSGLSELSGDNPKYIKTNKTIKPNALDSESERELYKIGYTSRTVAHRIATMYVPSGIKVTIVATLRFNRLVDAYNMEQILHKEYKSGRFYGKLLGNGNSELYVRDVLGLVYS